MNERTYIVTEVCPHCESEIEMRWDTDTLGFKAFCPVCGERLMLCDECQHSGPDGGPSGPCDYDGAADTCRFNRPRQMPEKEMLECESRSCVFNHGGGCRFSLVHERPPRITDKDGCIDYDYAEVM